MIRNQWYAVLESKEVKKGKMIGVKRMGERMLFWRNDEGQVTCLVDQCPHRGAQLSIGKIVNGHVQCPFHGLEFDEHGDCVYVPSIGQAAGPQAKFNAKHYPVHEMNDFIFIFWGEVEEDQELPAVGWVDELDHADFAYITVVDHWDVHYSRVIENQLDVAHLWLIHHNSIGRGNKRVVDGPVVEWCCEWTEPDLMSVWVNNKVDDGVSIGKLPKETQKPDRHAFLQMRMPNVWQNWIMKDMRVLGVFVPIDEEHARMYLRYYQRIVKFPVAKQLFLAAGWVQSLRVERQDKRVVQTQLPKRSDLRIGEKLFPGDHPILEYRRRRRELIEKNPN
ncbi:MAG: aromatic ring-hydroxylating dioxygenase subunit alpha [Anaerolineae bacterium]|jgi:phenylpropionate dioxygenase-like ring-hydroxylating dioxygenase large terminal subunit|nr:aromatic ring-hydroxylating dioxygenase subunit alpha [Anaerolineae bacterium]